MKTPVRRYAEGTSVSVAKSKVEVERLVKKHGATAFMTAWMKDRQTTVAQKLVPELDQLMEGGVLPPLLGPAT